MRIVVVGAGGVGGYFGARLARAGRDVTFVARGSHLQAMQTQGLRLDSEIGPLHLPKVKVVADAREMLDLVRADKVAPIPVELRPLDAASRSLDDLRAGKIVGRVVVTP